MVEKLQVFCVYQNSKFFFLWLAISEFFVFVQKNGAAIFSNEINLKLDKFAGLENKSEMWKVVWKWPERKKLFSRLGLLFEKYFYKVEKMRNFDWE